MLSGLINTAEKTILSPRQVKVDGGTQMRAGLHEETVEEYRQHFNEHHSWGDFPPVVVFHDGTDYWLADGFHRVEAARREFGNTPSGYIHAEVRAGTRRDAILYAAAANANHGLRRTNADKRRAVEALLRDEEWSQWSDREIGRRCGVSDVFVGKMRKELSANGLQIERTVQRGGVTFTQNTANIGTNQPTRTKTPIRHDATLPALNVPAPGTYSTPLGALPKNPIEDWELEDIVEQVATEYYGKVTRMVGDSMMLAAQSQAGEYWAKLRRVLEPFDADAQRIEAAVAATVERLVGERRALRPGSPEAKQLGREIKSATWGDQPLKQAAKPVKVEELDPWVAAWKVRPYDSMIKQADRLVVQLEPWAQAWTDDKGRTWRDVVGRNPQHANSPFRQDLEAACRQRGLVLTGEEMAETIRLLFSRLQLDAPMAESGSEGDGETAPAGKLLVDWTDEDWAAFAQQKAEESGALPMHIAEFEMPDDLIDVWSPRFDGDAGVYLVDVVRNRSTESVALDDLDELFAQARRMDGALDLVVDGDRPLPGWVDGAEQRAIDAAKRIAEATPAGWTATPTTAGDAVTLRDLELAAQAQAAPVSHREGYDSDEWYTPGWVIEAATAVMGQIDLDPASCELAQETVQAGLYWTKKQDGCHMTWFGRVWLNPPYSAPGAFVDKLLDEYTAGNVKQACVLLNNATETKWFQRLLARFPVCFFSQRLAFWRHDHEDVGARQGQALFYLGPDVEKFVEVFGEHGIVVKRLD